MTDLLTLLPHQPALAALQAAASQGRLPRFLVFAGPQGTGRRTAALALAKWLLCAEGPAPISFCGQCRACRLIDNDLHPDLIRLRPPLFTRRDHPWLTWVSHGKVEKAPRHSLQVSIVQARNMRAHSANPPAEGPCKVYLIEGADAMQLEANDTLLKTLEEPPSYAYFCLLADSPAALRPTVLSRALLIRLQPLPNSLLAEIVTEHYPAAAEQAARIASYAGGSPGLALQLAGDRSLLALADEACEMLRRALGGDRLAALRDASRLRALATQWFVLRYQPPTAEDAPEEQDEHNEEPEPAPSGAAKVPAAATRLGAVQIVDLLGSVVRNALRSGDAAGTMSLPSVRGTAVTLNILSESRAALEANANLASCLSGMMLAIAEAAGREAIAK